MTIFDYVFKFGDGVGSLWTALESVFSWSARIGSVTFSFWSLLGGGILLAVIVIVLTKAITPFL